MLPSRTIRLTSVSLPRIHARTYVVSVKPPLIYPGKPEPRIYSTRKTFLYNQYTRLLETSYPSPLIFLEHKDFTIQRLIKLRSDIAKASTRHVPSLSNPSPTPTPIQPTLSVIRTAIFGVALRDFTPLDLEAAEEIAKLVDGGLAVLTLPSLNPPQLNAILRALDRAVPPKKPLTPEELEQKRLEKEADPATPGRRMKRQRPIMIPELKLVGALIEGRVFTAPGVHDVSKLPTLDTLRAQIVGLLGSPSTQLAAVLSEASGGRLARTLEGLKKTLEEGQSSLETGPPS